VTETDIAIVGAGVAGLSAAAAIRGAGLRCELLEATGRIGGRAYTETPAALSGAPFDHGASWLHAAQRNPLAEIALRHGDQLSDSDAAWTRDLPGSDEAAYDAAQERFAKRVAGLAAGPDTSFATAIDAIADDPWTATIEAFEATMIAAADSRELSLRDWQVNDLEEGNRTVAGGLGAFVARRLAQEARLATPVRRVSWNAGGVTLETPSGTLRAGGCIVTVSTGVLRAGGIAFAPELPASHLAALDGLPMGLLTKVALAASGPDRLGLPKQCSVVRRLTRRHAPMMAFIAWPDGAAHVIGFVGGSTAWGLTREDPAATAAFARDCWTDSLGGRARNAIAGAIVTNWGADPAFLGSYAYARPGHADARAALREELAGGRLVFAGEAVARDGLAGTVGGAWNSGAEAAAIVIAALSPQ